MSATQRAQEALSKATRIVAEAHATSDGESGLALPYLDQVGAAIEELAGRDALASRLAGMIRELHLAEGRKVTDEQCLDLLIGGSQAVFVRSVKQDEELADAYGELEALRARALQMGAGLSEYEANEDAWPDDESRARFNRVHARLAARAGVVRKHTSDCAVHNAPAMEPGKCDCPGVELAEGGGCNCEACVKGVRCLNCLDTGMVCENHPDKPWAGVIDAERACCPDGVGMPCRTCCSPIPEDGTTSITEAFVPDYLRDAAVN